MESKIMFNRWFIIIILISWGSASFALDFDPMTLLGLEKSRLDKYKPLYEDCIVDLDREVLGIPSKELEGLLPYSFPVNKGTVEIGLSSCSNDAKVVEITFPITQEKFEELKKFYEASLGKAEVMSHANDLQWNSRATSFYLNKISENEFVFGIKVNEGQSK